MIIITIIISISYTHVIFLNTASFFACLYLALI